MKLGIREGVKKTVFLYIKVWKIHGIFWVDFFSTLFFCQIFFPVSSRPWSIFDSLVIFFISFYPFFLVFRHYFLLLLLIYLLSFLPSIYSLSSMSVLIATGIIGNILSVVGVVITNKYIIEKDGFNFSVFLSFLHFAFTSLCTQVLLRTDQLTYKSAPINSVLPVAIGSLLSVAFMNLNLAFNSVGLYQVRFFSTSHFSMLTFILWYTFSLIFFSF